VLTQPTVLVKCEGSRILMGTKHALARSIETRAGRSIHGWQGLLTEHGSGFGADPGLHFEGLCQRERPCPALHALCGRVWFVPTMFGTPPLPLRVLRIIPRTGHMGCKSGTQALRPTELYSSAVLQMRA
jgi:hypothetical protein